MFLYDQLHQYPKLKEIIISQGDKLSQSSTEYVELIAKNNSTQLQSLYLELNSFNIFTSSKVDLRDTKSITYLTNLDITVKYNNFAFSTNSCMLYMMKKFPNLKRFYITPSDDDDSDSVTRIDENSISTSAAVISQFLKYLQKLQKCSINIIVPHDELPNIIEGFYAIASLKRTPISLPKLIITYDEIEAHPNAQIWFRRHNIYPHCLNVIFNTECDDYEQKALNVIEKAGRHLTTITFIITEIEKLLPLFYHIGKYRDNLTAVHFCGSSPIAGYVAKMQFVHVIGHNL